MQVVEPKVPVQQRQQHGRSAVVYGVLDQGVSSATNFLALFVTANLVDRYQFGYFSIAYIVYTLFLSASQALFGQVIVLETDNVHVAIGNAVRNVVLITATIAVPLGSVAFLIAPTDVRAMYGYLAIFVPLLLAQDVLRYGASALRIPRTAFVSDISWLVSFVVIVTIAYRCAEDITGTTIMAAWCVSGTLAYMFISFNTRRWRTTTTDRIMRDPRYLGYRFLGEFGMTRAISQVSMVILGLVASVAATGAIRGVSTLFGPINILINSVVVFVTPIFVRDPQSRTARMASISIGLFSLSLVLTILLAITPDSIGSHILGDTWGEASRLVVPLGLQVASLAAGSAAFTGLRVVDPRSTLPIRIWSSGISLMLFPLGYIIDGVTGFAWSLTAVAAIQSVWAWCTYMRLSRL